MSDQSTILTRLQRLMAMTVENGASEAEAMLAAAKASELMQQHGLSFKSVEEIEAQHCDLLRDACLPVTYLEAVREAFSPDDYFKRAPKDVAIAEIDEMREAGAAQGLAPEDVLAGMKKADLTAAAAEAAKACGWLPPELRNPAYTISAQRDEVAA